MRFWVPDEVAGVNMRARWGFTLPELLIVLLLIALFAAVLVPLCRQTMTREATGESSEAK